VRVGSAASTASVQFGYTTGPAGLAEVAFTFVSPNGLQAYGNLYVDGPALTSGSKSVTFVSQPALLAQPGTWTLGSAVVYDRAGNSTPYDAAQLKTLFAPSTFKMVNTGPYDATPPALVSAHLVSDTVHLSDPMPALEVAVQGDDGAGSGIYQATAYLMPPKFGFVFGSPSALTRPVASGVVPTVNPLGGVNIKGTWSIYSLELCDAANNCSRVDTPEGVRSLLGTNTFTVAP